MIPFSWLSRKSGSTKAESELTLPDLVRSRAPTSPAWPIWTAPDPGDDALRRELRSRIDRAIDSLPPRQRQVITLRDLEDRGAAEVSERLEISDGNQRVLLHRARLRVRRELDPYLDLEAGRADIPANGDPAGGEATTPRRARRRSRHGRRALDLRPTQQ